MKDQFFKYMLERFGDSEMITLVINPNNFEIVDINNAGEKFFCYDKTFLIGKSYSELLSEKDTDKTRVLLFHQSKSQNNTFSNVLKHLTSTGQLKEVEVVPLKVETNDSPVLFLFLFDRTDLMIMNRKLRASEEKFQKLLMDIPSISVQGYYMDGTTFYWNKASKEIYGYTEEEAIGKNLLDLIIPPELRSGVASSIENASLTGIAPEASELQLMHKDGSVVDVFSSHAVLAFEEKPLEMYCIDIDISERKIARQLRLAANVFTHALEPILITDSNARIIDVNDKFTEVLGYEKNEVISKNPNMLKSGLHDKNHYEKMWRDLIENGVWRGEVFNRKKNGEIIPMLIRINAVKDAKGVVQNYICFFTDLTYVKKHQEALERAAFYDSLTGLPNRTLFYKRLLSVMTDRRANTMGIALAYLDLDGFKFINDEYGHDVGDYFLKEISSSLQSQLREGDTLARIGGDEFVAILVDLKSKKDLMHLLERLLAAARKEISYLNVDLKVSASIGVAMYPVDGIEPDALMRKADEAMYNAKKNGKNKYVMC